MDNRELEDKLSRLGYSLLETTHSFDVHVTLADVVESNNVRYLEGFPVLLANAVKGKSFDYSKILELLNKHEQERLRELLLLSLALYELQGLEFPSLTESAGQMSNEDTAMVKNLKDSLVSGRWFALAGHRFDPERLKNAFMRYFTLAAEEVQKVGLKQEQLSLEFALSQTFSPKQKDLFRKKLKGEALTKTEKEYFSRVVRKKIVALANPELHRLAQNLLER